MGWGGGGGYPGGGTLEVRTLTPFFVMPLDVMKCG